MKDTVTIQYLKNNEVFPDAFNFFIYGGRKVIDPNGLVELDTREIGVPYGGDSGAEQPVQKIRDVIKAVAAMTDQRAAYMILAIEAQSNIHYAMPVKDMVYDAMQYAKQVEKAVASHRVSGDYKGIGSDEYLSGFLKDDHLMPVVTLVVYFDSKEWDGPLSIHEMFDCNDKNILALVPNYKINLLAPASIRDEEFDQFNTTLKEVMAFIKYSKDKDKLKAVVDKDAGFRRLGRNEVNVLNQCVNAKLRLKENEEVVDVCQALEDLQKEAANNERITTLLNGIKSLMEKMDWTAEQSMDMLNVSETDRKQLARMM